MFHLQIRFMTRMNVCFWILLVSFLIGCSRDERTQQGNHIVVVGTAINLVAHAVIESNENYFYLDKVASWDKKILGTKVRVEGELFVKIYPPPPCPEPAVGPDHPPPPPAPRMVGDFELFIKNPKW
jgi:hypothetical protein